MLQPWSASRCSLSCPILKCWLFPVRSDHSTGVDRSGTHGVANCGPKLQSCPPSTVPSADRSVCFQRCTFVPSSWLLWKRVWTKVAPSAPTNFDETGGHNGACQSSSNLSVEPGGQKPEGKTVGCNWSGWIDLFWQLHSFALSGDTV